MKQLSDFNIFCSSFCNFGHDVKTGKPLNHECVVIPPKALLAERSGDINLAIDIMQAAKPWKNHKGIKTL